MTTRLSINISRNTEAALLDVHVQEDVSFTEATRRLIGYGHLVYQAVREGREVVIQGAGKPSERLVLLDEAAKRAGAV